VTSAGRWKSANRKRRARAGTHLFIKHLLKTISLSERVFVNDVAATIYVGEGGLEWPA
jgi:hypothetical protein